MIMFKKYFHKTRGFNTMVSKNGNIRTNIIVRKRKKVVNILIICEDERTKTNHYKNNYDQIKKIFFVYLT